MRCEEGKGRKGGRERSEPRSFMDQPDLARMILADASSIGLRVIFKMNPSPRENFHRHALFGLIMTHNHRDHITKWLAQPPLRTRNTPRERWVSADVDANSYTCWRFVLLKSISSDRAWWPRPHREQFQGNFESTVERTKISDTINRHYISW